MELSIYISITLKAINVDRQILKRRINMSAISKSLPGHLIVAVLSTGVGGQQKIKSQLVGHHFLLSKFSA